MSKETGSKMKIYEYKLWIAVQDNCTDTPEDLEFIIGDIINEDLRIPRTCVLDLSTSILKYVGTTVIKKPDIKYKMGAANENKSEIEEWYKITDILMKSI